MYRGFSSVGCAPRARPAVFVVENAGFAWFFSANEGTIILRTRKEWQHSPKRSHFDTVPSTKTFSVAREHSKADLSALPSFRANPCRYLPLSPFARTRLDTNAYLPSPCSLPIRTSPYFGHRTFGRLPRCAPAEGLPRRMGCQTGLDSGRDRHSRHLAR